MPPNVSQDGRRYSAISLGWLHRDSVCRLHDLIEIDEAFVGGRHGGQRGRGAAGKSPVLVAVEFDAYSGETENL